MTAEVQPTAMRLCAHGMGRTGATTTAVLPMHAEQMLE